jgi:hypothetical protein
MRPFPAFPAAHYAFAYLMTIRSYRDISPTSVRLRLRAFSSPLAALDLLIPTDGFRLEGTP